jgi:heme/copper-type cytochrome/quinol oxidase subunit 4
METALYTVKIPNKEYIPLIEDIVRMVIVQMTIQFLYFINNKDGEAFFSVEFILLLVYIILGVCIYWLIFKKTVIFV